jgi:small GTP-binding protein
MSSGDKRIFKIGVCGPQASGKTSLVSRLAGNPIIDPPPTIGVEFYSKGIQGSDLKLHFWDLAGGRQYMYITDMYIKKLDLMLYTYNTTDQEQQRELRGLYQEYEDKGVTRNAILVGTHTESESQQSTSLVDHLAVENSLPHIRVSSTTGENIDVLFRMITGFHHRAVAVRSTPAMRITTKQKEDKCIIL